MFEAWGRRLYGARRLVLVIAVLFAIGAGIWGTGVFGKLTSGNTFTPPASESNRESALAASVFGRNEADVVVLFRRSPGAAPTPPRCPRAPPSGRCRTRWPASSRRTRPRRSRPS